MLIAALDRKQHSGPLESHLEKRSLAHLRSRHRSPSQHAARQEQLARVGAAIERLPDDYRRVIQLVRLEDRSANAIRILYYRAIRKLRSELSAN